MLQLTGWLNQNLSKAYYSRYNTFISRNIFDNNGASNNGVRVSIMGSEYYQGDFSRFGALIAKYHSQLTLIKPPAFDGLFLRFLLGRQRRV